MVRSFLAIEKHPEHTVWYIPGACGAANQNRTDDPILTMDVLCRLSYSGAKVIIIYMPSKIKMFVYPQACNQRCGV